MIKYHDNVSKTLKFFLVVRHFKETITKLKFRLKKLVLFFCFSFTKAILFLKKSP